MKKRVLTVALGLCAVVIMAGCSKELSNDDMVIKQYKGLEVEKVEAAKVTDEDVEAEIQATLKEKGKDISITDRPVENGDSITLDYSGKVDGEVFDGGTAENQSLTIGSGQFIPGFEEAIIGHMVGETFDIDVTFPEDYGQATLAGKPAVFTITIDKITGYPELTEELLTELEVEEKTVEDYKKAVKKQLQEENKQNAESTFEQNIWNALMKQCEVDKYPQDQYDAVVKNIESQFSYVAQMYGQDVDTIVQAYYGVSMDEMAKNLVKQEIAVELIAKKEKLNVTEKEYAKRIVTLAEEYGYEDADEFEETAGKENLEKMMTQENVANWLKENCKIVEKKASK